MDQDAIFQTLTRELDSKANITYVDTELNSIIFLNI
jgi:hypothetical protein